MRSVAKVIGVCALVAAPGLAVLFSLDWSNSAPAASASDPRVAAAILALAEDNVKLREAYASCGRSRAGLEEALKKERAK